MILGHGDGFVVIGEGGIELALGLQGRAALKVAAPGDRQKQDDFVVVLDGAGEVALKLFEVAPPEVVQGKIGLQSDDLVERKIKGSA